MKTIHIVIDAPLLKAADGAAKKARQNRSELIRDALRHYLRRLQVKALEEQERLGYERFPDDPNEHKIWEAEAVWPPL